MARVQGGIQIGLVPDPTSPNGVRALCDLSGPVAPTAMTQPAYGSAPLAVGPASQIDLEQENVITCAIGSTYRDYIGGHFYLKTAMPTGAAPNGSWTEIA
jgi:hypothetical protein